MPFKSKAQRRKFAELLVNGKISPEVYEEWNRDTGRAELPERVQPKAKKRGVRKAKSTVKRKPGPSAARRSGSRSAVPKTPKRRSGS